MEFADRITDLAGLREIYRDPARVAVDKVFDRIDAATAEFIDRCPFVIIATSDGVSSMDASPRGGPPGFVRRLDDRHVAIPDLNGNNRLDSLENIVRHPYVGLLFVVPGKDETVRINGPATITTDDAVLDGFTSELRRPTTAVVVEVAELYGHCAKAFRRARVWDHEAWAELDSTPDLADIVAEQFQISAADSRDALEATYDHDLALD